MMNKMNSSQREQEEVAWKVCLLWYYYCWWISFKHFVDTILLAVAVVFVCIPASATISSISHIFDFVYFSHVSHTQAAGLRNVQEDK